MMEGMDEDLEIQQLRTDIRFVVSWFDRVTFEEFSADPDGARIVRDYIRAPSR